jgi:hypothetical protein
VFDPLGTVLAVATGVTLVDASLETLRHFNLAIVYAGLFWVVGSTLAAFYLPGFLHGRLFGRLSIAAEGEGVDISGTTLRASPSAALVVDTYELENLAGETAWKVYRVRWIEDTTNGGLRDPPSGWRALFGGDEEVLVGSGRDPLEVRRFAERLAALTGVELVWRSADGEILERQSADHLRTPLTDRLVDRDLPAWPAETLTSAEELSANQRPDGTVEIEWCVRHCRLLGAALAWGVGCFVLGAAMEMLDTDPNLWQSGLTVGGPLGLLGGIYAAYRWLRDRAAAHRIVVGPERLEWSYRAWGLVATTRSVSADAVRQIHLGGAKTLLDYHEVIAVGEEKLYARLAPNWHDPSVDGRVVRGLLYHGLAGSMTE